MSYRELGILSWTNLLFSWSSKRCDLQRNHLPKYSLALNPLKTCYYYFDNSITKIALVLGLYVSFVKKQVNICDIFDSVLSHSDRLSDADLSHFQRKQ